MENQNTEEAPAPKKGGFMKILIIAVVLLAVAGGAAGGYFYWSKAKAAEAQEEAEETPKKPKKAASPDDEGEHAADDEEVKAVIELPPFIINLADTDQARYLRMTVSLGIAGEEGGKGEKPDPVFNTRVRNAILTVLMSKRSEEILTEQGKAKLRKEILKAAQEASEEPHVAAIYITDFIVQL